MFSTAFVGWYKVRVEQSRVSQAELEMRFQRAALSFPDFVEEWSEIHNTILKLMEETDVPAHSPTDIAGQMQAMNADTFWSLIEKTVPFHADQDAQLHALHDVLDALDPGTIEGFEAAFQSQLQRALTWDLWGAAYVIHGGMADDGFEYFRTWLIARGRDVFDQALADPDGLGTAIPDDADEPCEFEEFGYAAIDVWTRKTGVDPLGDPASTFPSAGSSPATQPTGTPFKDTEAYLSKRYPKLWKRFSGEPLG